ncbi:uncharacterized protein K460DRAFT_274958, partial [Cucurbitaria berberidis CBS 394.84]
TSTKMLAKDPWLWTVDNLVAELCHSEALFQAAGYGLGNSPNPAMLEHRIRNQQITGVTFLTASSTHALGLELDIYQQAALSAVIRLLRHRSFIYKQCAATKGVESLDLNSASSSRVPNTFSDPESIDETGRKRRKVAHIITEPLSNTSQPALEAATGWTAGNASDQAISGGGEWDHLLRRHQPGGEEEIDLAELDDSEDEERSGYADGAEEEQDVPDEDVEPEQGAQGRSKLSSEQVIEIINERIDYYTNSWKPDKGAVKGEEILYDPNAMWEKAEATGQRQQLVDRHETDLAYYTQRLDRLCDEILKFPGSNADQVRHQCRNLEVTIDLMQLAEWSLSIYRLEPVYDSDDETDGPDTSNEPQLHAGMHQSRPSVEIVDLGSPETSVAEDVIILDHSTELARNMDAHHDHTPTLSHLQDVSIAETVESPIYANPEPPAQARALPLGLHGDEPEHASIATIRGWRWAGLVDTQDRKRIVSKAVLEMRTEDRELIRTRLKFVGKTDMIKEIRACLGMMFKGLNKMQGVLSKDLPKIVTLTRLFLSWWLCDDYSREKPSIWHLEELQKCLDEGAPDLRIFCDYLDTIMATTFSEEALRHPERPSQAEVIEISDDDDEPPARPTTQRKNRPNKLVGMEQGSVIVLD